MSAKKQLPKLVKCPACGEVKPAAMVSTEVELDGKIVKICDSCDFELLRLDE